MLLALAMIFSICAMSAIAGETPAPESGEADVAAWTEAVAGLEGMGINDAIAAQQAALDRFNAR